MPLNKDLITVIIFTIFLTTAIILGNLFLVSVLNRPLEEVPTIAKVIVHGITLGILFAFVKRYFSR